jgi:hypothetical protein
MLADELMTDIPPDRLKEPDDLTAVLDAWRDYSARYVALAALEGAEVEEAVERCEAHDEAAAILERLMKHLPRERV